MEKTIKVFVDRKAMGNQSLMEELSEQFKALEIGKVKEVKEEPPTGTLAGAETVILVLTITNLTLQISKALFEVIRETRAKSAATLRQPLNEIPPVLVEESGEVIKVTGLNPTKKEQAFLDKIQSEENEK